MPARSSSRRLAALSAHLVAADEAVPDSDEVLYAVDGPIAIITLNVSSRLLPRSTVARADPPPALYAGAGAHEHARWRPDPAHQQVLPASRLRPGRALRDHDRRR